MEGETVNTDKSKTESWCMERRVAWERQVLMVRWECGQRLMRHMWRLEDKARTQAEAPVLPGSAHL